jgi:hypothetical protein
MVSHTSALPMPSQTSLSGYVSTLVASWRPIRRRQEGAIATETRSNDPTRWLVGLACETCPSCCPSPIGFPESEQREMAGVNYMRYASKYRPKVEIRIRGTEGATIE